MNRRPTKRPAPLASGQVVFMKAVGGVPAGLCTLKQRLPGLCLETGTDQWEVEDAAGNRWIRNARELGRAS